MTVVVDPCLSVADVERPAPLQWLGQDGEGSHVVRLNGAAVTGWQVIDLSGRAVARQQGATASELLRIALPGEASGPYVLQVSGPEGVQHLRLLHLRP